MNIEWITSVSLIAADPEATRKLFVGGLGLPLEPDATGEYFYSGRIGGAKHFGIWPLAQAAQACFGTDQWPSDRPLPQVSIEFEMPDVAAVAAAAAELAEQGHALLHGAHEEPWGQTVARLQSPDGAIVGISYAPSQHAG